MSCFYMSCFFFTCSSNYSLLHVDFYVMLAAMLWSQTRSLVHVYMLCSLCKHPPCSHMKFYTLTRKHHRGHPTIYHKHHAHHLHHWSVMLSMCILMVWGIFSSSHWVGLQGCICTNSLAHTLSHFCWSFNDQITLSIAGTPPHHQLNRLSPNNAKTPNKWFQALLTAS